MMADPGIAHSSLLQMCDLLWCDPYRADAYQTTEQEASPPEGEEGLDGWDSDDSEEVSLNDLKMGEGI
jgi:hypothetical protein